MATGVQTTFLATAGAVLLLATSGAVAAGPAYGMIAPAGARSGDLAMAPCEVYLDADDRHYAADCGTLVVPENRRRPGSRLIAVPVTRIRALGAAPLEPVFWFQGGPGNANEMHYPTDGILKRHDFVVVGYRGVDGQVVLKCPEIGDAVRARTGGFLGDGALESYARATAACARRLEAEGIDLDGYSMNETIDDMEAARIALGYPRINLLGNSYGTRVELLYEWRYPGSLRRVVTVSANPPGHFIFYPRVIERQLGQYAALCARDAHCRSRTRDLLATLRQVSHDMPTRWLGIPINPDAIRMFTFFSLMESVATPGSLLPSHGPAVIDMWLDAAEGDASGMALASLLAPRLLPWLFERGHLLAMGASAPDFLGPHRDLRAEFMPADTILGSPMSLIHAAMVPGWPAASDRSSAVAQDSAVETLVVSGSIDFSTPMEAARDELLPHLSHGHQVVLRDFGHTETIWNSQPDARARLLNTFFDTGVVDASLYRYQAPKFDVDRSWGGLAKLLLGVVSLAAALLASLIVLVTRRLRRRRAARRAIAA